MCPLWRVLLSGTWFEAGIHSSLSVPTLAVPVVSSPVAPATVVGLGAAIVNGGGTVNRDDFSAGALFGEGVGVIVLTYGSHAN